MSAARVVYDYYGGAERFPTISDEMMDAVDKADAAQFSEDEILDPQGWILMTFLMDPRTGLGRFREFRDLELPADDAADRRLHAA